MSNAVEAGYMQYPVSNRHGDIGEHLVAFRIMKVLNWPCRLLNIDLGIDAEVEMLAEDLHTTGDILKIQVKNRKRFPKKGKASVKIREKHFLYWTRFCSPVVFCAVCVATERVFWKHLTALDNIKGGGKQMRVTFDVERDLLTADTVREWRKFASPPQVHELKQLMEDYLAFEEFLHKDPMDGEYSTWLDGKFNEAAKIAKKIESLISYLPWKVSGVELSNFRMLQESFHHAKKNNSLAGNYLDY